MKLNASTMRILDGKGLLLGSNVEFDSILYNSVI